MIDYTGMSYHELVLELVKDISTATIRLMTGDSSYESQEKVLESAIYEAAIRQAAAGTIIIGRDPKDNHMIADVYKEPDSGKYLMVPIQGEQ